MNKKITASIMSLLMIAMAMPVMAETNNVIATGNIQVDTCPVGVVGLSLSENNINFGPIYPGDTASEFITIIANANGYNPQTCNGNEEAPGTVDVGIALSDWLYGTNTMPSTVTVVNGLPGTLDVGTSYSVNFDVTPEVGTTPGAYTQTITISATY